MRNTNTPNTKTPATNRRVSWLRFHEPDKRPRTIRRINRLWHRVGPHITVRVPDVRDVNIQAVGIADTQDNRHVRRQLLANHPRPNLNRDGPQRCRWVHAPNAFAMPVRFGAAVANQDERLDPKVSLGFRLPRVATRGPRLLDQDGRVRRGASRRRGATGAEQQDERDYEPLLSSDPLIRSFHCAPYRQRLGQRTFAIGRPQPHPRIRRKRIGIAEPTHAPLRLARVVALGEERRRLDGVGGQGGRLNRTAHSPTRSLDLAPER